MRLCPRQYVSSYTTNNLKKIRNVPVEPPRWRGLPQAYDLLLGVITLIPILHIADTVALCCVLVQMAGFEPACLTTPNFNFGLYTHSNTSVINLQLRIIRFCLPPSLRCLVLVATLTGRVTCSTFFIFRITEDYWHPLRDSNSWHRG